MSKATPPPRPEREEFIHDVALIGEQDKQLMITTSDSNKYIHKIEFIPLDTITRVSYNAVLGQLTMVINETTGGFGETLRAVGAREGDPVPPEGKESEEEQPPVFHWVTEGRIKSMEIVIGGEDLIQQVLMSYLNIPFTAKFLDLFQGFKAHKAQQLKLDAAIKEQELKRKAATEANPSSKIQVVKK